MIRNRFAEILAQKGIRQVEVFAKTGISKTTLSAIANNATDMVKFDTIDQICRYLEISPADFFDFTPYIWTISCESVYIDPINSYDLVVEIVFENKYETKILTLSGLYEFYSSSEGSYFGGRLTPSSDPDDEHYISKINSLINQLNTGFQEMLKKDIEKSISEHLDKDNIHFETGSIELMIAGG